MRMRWIIRALSLTVILFAVLTAACLSAFAQAAIMPNPFEKIPRTVSEGKRLSHGVMFAGGAQDTDEFKTYSFFLIPDDKWPQRNRPELSSLEEAFKNFGAKIGGQHLAIWFTTLGYDHDVRRDQEFCRKKFNLSVSEGPYVVMMRKHPDDLKKDDKVLAIKLNNISAERVQHVLNILVEDLHSGAAIHEEAIELERLLQIFLSAKDKHGLTGIVIALFKLPSN